MKNIFKTGALALLLTIGLSSCNDFFDSVPGVQYDLDGTFKSRLKTEQFLNDIYSYVPDETNERWSGGGDKTGIWTTGSLETNITWGNNGSEWVSGITYASSSWVNFYYIEYYKAISKASTFITNVDNCTEATSEERKVWKAQARGLRAFAYFQIFRIYGPCVILGEDALALDTPISELLKERNSVDECVDFITNEFDVATADLPAKYSGGNWGRMDAGACKALKAKLLLYAASPLFNCNPDYAEIKNQDGKQLFPQDKSQEQAKWEAARQAYKEFFDTFVPSQYRLFTTTTVDGKIDFYESYRLTTSGSMNSGQNSEAIFVRLADHSTRSYEVTPYHNQTGNGELRGGLGFGVPQETVDLFFTDKGIRTVEDADYKEYTGVPSSEYYGWSGDYNDPLVPERRYFAGNSDMTLKQWANREPRFYVNVTFNGSTWLNTTTADGELTTDLTVNGNSGLNAAGHDAPIEGYGMRKMAPKNGTNGNNPHCANLLRLADMYLGYAEALSACGQYAEAMTYVNAVRARAGIPGYGNAGGQDANGFDYLAYPENRQDVDKRIRRERLIELMFEWNHFFDVRRWKVADMSVGDDWIYPSYHRGGEGGEIHGMNQRASAPEFFEKVVTESRVFDKRHYLLPIPEADINRNPKMVQNYGWTAVE